MDANLSQLELLILSVLLQKERYGLDIIEAVREATGGKKTLSIGSLYTTLHRMEDKGLVASRWGETTEPRRGARRRYYRILGLGHRAVNEAQRTFAALWRPVRAT